MRHRPRPVLAMALCAALHAAALAGPLNPPAGPIVPTPGPEPRTPISAATTPGDAGNLFIISLPGSYYLTGDLAGVSGKSGVRISAANVTLDLMGFSLIGVSGSLDGVSMATFFDNVVVQNGQVSGWGRHGLNLDIDSGRIERITAVGNGGWGIYNDPGAYIAHIISCEARNCGGQVANTGGFHCGGACVVRDCLARHCSGIGFSISGVGSEIEACAATNTVGEGFVVGDRCALSRCVASSNSIAGIHASARCVLRECSASENLGDGVLAGIACSVIDTTASNCPGNGISVGDRAIVRGCDAANNAMHGIAAGNHALIRDCNTTGNTLDNILVGGSSSVIACTANLSASGHGINASSSQSHVEGCTANGNALNGVHASQRTQVINCVASSNLQNGVHSTFAGSVRGCFCESNTICGILTDAGGYIEMTGNYCAENGISGSSGAGIRVLVSLGCRIEGNTLDFNFRALDIQTTGNFVAHNSFGGNANPVNIIAGNTVGPFVDSSNIATNNNPNANFTH